MRHRFAAAAAIVIAAVGLSACGAAVQRDDTIRIGAVLDITGPGASLGGPEQKALEMLVNELNAKGGINGQQVELFVEDNQSREDVAARVTNSLISQQQVDLIIGASRTGPSLAMRPIVEEAETPMISLAANHAIIDGSEWVFKTAQDDRIILERMVDYAISQGWTRLGLVKDSSAYGEGIGETLQELGAERGIQVIVEERFEPNATEFTAQMINLRNAATDANIIWGIEPAATLALRAYRQAGVDVPIMMGHGVANQDFLRTGAGAAEGVIVPQGPLLVAGQLDDSDPQKEVINEFVAAYTDRYGEPPSPFAAYAFDAYLMAERALSGGALDRASIRDALQGITGLNGATGVFNMSPQDHSGLGSDSVVLGTVTNGEWMLVK